MEYCWKLKAATRYDLPETSTCTDMPAQVGRSVCRNRPMQFFFNLHQRLVQDRKSILSSDTLQCTKDLFGTPERPHTRIRRAVDLHRQPVQVDCSVYGWLNINNLVSWNKLLIKPLNLT